jgi:hypothetical protein
VQDLAFTTLGSYGTDVTVQLFLYPTLIEPNFRMADDLLGANAERYGVITSRLISATWASCVALQKG